MNATDTLSAQQVAGFTYRIDWGDGTPAQTLDRVPSNAAGLSVNHTFDVSRSYTVALTATDSAGRASTAVTQTTKITAAALQRDPANSRKKALVVGGTPGNDKIECQPVGKSKVLVLVNGKSEGTFAPTGYIIVYGRAGNDQISIASNLAWPTLLFGEDGNDRITAGSGPSVLLGGNGKDQLTGGKGCDLVIGGTGADCLAGDVGDDVRIAGSTRYDADPSSLAALQREWARTNTPFASRVAHLKGTAGGLNGAAILGSHDVFDDSVADLLTGGAGTDAFWFNNRSGVKDTLADRLKSEIITSIRLSWQCPMPWPASASRPLASMGPCFVSTEGHSNLGNSGHYTVRVVIERDRPELLFIGGD